MHKLIPYLTLLLLLSSANAQNNTPDISFYQQSVEPLVVQTPVSFSEIDYDHDLSNAFQGNRSLQFSWSTAKSIWIGELPLVAGKPTTNQSFAQFPDMIVGDVTVSLTYAQEDVEVFVIASSEIISENYSLTSRFQLFNSSMSQGSTVTQSFSKRNVFNMYMLDNGSWMPRNSYYNYLYIEKKTVVISSINVQIKVKGNWTHRLELNINLKSEHNPEFYKLMLSRLPEPKNRAQDVFTDESGLQSLIQNSVYFFIAIPILVYLAYRYRKKIVQVFSKRI